MSTTVFYLVAILLVIASPLAVPVTVTIVHAISSWRQNAAAARPATAGAVRPPTRPVFALAIRGAVPAAA